MFIKSILPFWVATAIVPIVYAQGEGDADKTRALFAGTEWCSLIGARRSSVKFEPNGTLTIKASGSGGTDRIAQWMVSGPGRVSGDTWEWVLSPDKKELYAKKGPSVAPYYRGTAMPPEFPYLRPTLAKSGIVWVMQGGNERKTIAFNMDLDVVHGIDGVKGKPPTKTSIYGGSAFYLHGGECENVFFLVQDEKGERYLCNWFDAIYKPEPARPSDPLAPQKISRAKSPLNGTTWCRLDNKGKLITLTFAANGTVSDFDFPKEKPEWDPYDNGSVRYKASGGVRKLMLDADKKRLVREDPLVREVWFAGRTPPRVGLAETKQLKDTLADPSKAWVNWDSNKKTVYAFDDKTANVNISVDDGKPTVARWEALCAGCIRIGDLTFMLEGDTLERVESRLTLKQVSKDSL
ncbi:MAG: hypothetical protein FWH21_06345 [Kiritimatiellaeota bacterium]|nr:hypothetical protein [Kiritimatiellota bacterium]